ncbi:hypothetical protein Tco_1261502 [Tanacetum coccineum]
MDFENELNRLQEMINLINSNQDPPVDLYHLEGSDKGDNKIDSLTKEPLDILLMGDDVISTILARETDEFIKSSVDDLVPIPRESEVTSDSDLECYMPATIPLPTTDVREENLDINLPLREHLDTLSTGDRYGYIKNHKKTVKNGQARARESEENKKKPKNQNRSQKVKDRSQIQSTWSIADCQLGNPCDYICDPTDVIASQMIEEMSGYDCLGLEQQVWT